MTTSKQSSEEISVFWGKDSLLKGIVTSEGIFRLDGKVEGEIHHRGTLIIGETAVIKGRVEASTLILNGRLEGDATAGERIEIQASGKLFGTLSTPVVVIQAGGILEGNCNMGAGSGNGSRSEG